jgi:hypothetical protein
MIEPGKYIATVEDYSVGKSKEKGTPFLNFKFKIKDTGKNIYWAQYVTANTIDRLSVNLIETGLLLKNDFNQMAQGAQSGCIDLAKEVEIVVISEEYTSDSGELKTATKVQYVNVVGGGSMASAVDEKEAVQLFSGLNIGASILAARQKLGAEAPAQTPTPTADDIPF